MAIHNLQVITATVDSNDLEVDLAAEKQTIVNWVANYQEVLETQRADFSTGNTEMDGSGTDYAMGSWRFALEEDPLQMKDTIATYLNNNFKWWIVRYHQCDHDEQDRQGCSWDNRWTGGASLPADVDARFSI